MGLLAIMKEIKCKNLNSARQVLIEAEEKEASGNDYCCMGDIVGDKLNDKEWVRKLFIKAEKKAVSSEDYVCLAKAVMEHL